MIKIANLSSLRKFSTIRILVLSLAVAVLLSPTAGFAQKSNSLASGVPASGFCGVFGSTYLKVPCPFKTAGGPAGDTTAGGLILNVITILLAVVGSVSVLFLMIGGYRYVTAQGNEEQAEEAKKTMKHAIFGLVIVVLSFTIVSIITNVLIRGRGGVF